MTDKEGPDVVTVDGQHRNEPRPLRALWAWIGKFSDEHRWFAVTSTVTSVLGATLFLQAVDLGVRATWWGVLPALPFVALGPVVSAAAVDWRKAEEAATGNASRDVLLWDEGAKPLAKFAGELAQGASPHEQRFGQALQHSVAACCLMFSESVKVRSQVFRVENVGLMSRVASAGRNDDSQGFVATNRRGKKAFEVLKRGETIVEDDLAPARQARGNKKWPGTGASYRSFITVPLAVGTEGYGLLTVDSPEPKVFGRVERVYIEAIAALVTVLLAEDDRAKRSVAD